jgi:hypothetical protein
MQIKGTIKRINATIEISDKFSKRELFVETSEQYPQIIGVQFENIKCEMLNKYSVGQNVIVDVNLRGRDWQKADEIRNITYLQGWKIESDAF